MSQPHPPPPPPASLGAYSVSDVEAPKLGTLSLSDLESTGDLVASQLRAVRDSDWTRPVQGLDWTCWQTADHLATVLLTFAARAAGRATDSFPMARSSDPTLSGSQVVDLIASSTRLLGLALGDLHPGSRIFHPAGLADQEGYVAMACDELLVHGAEISAMDDPFQPPSEIAGLVVRRLFPWAPAGFGGWETLRWANDRADLGDHSTPGPTWVWWCRPLEEWDGSVPQWDSIGQRVIDPPQ